MQAKGNTARKQIHIQNKTTTTIQPESERSYSRNQKEELLTYQDMRKKMGVGTHTKYANMIKKVIEKSQSNPRL